MVATAGLLSFGCGGGGEEPPPPTTAPPATTPGGATEGTVGAGQAESLRDIPFTLNEDQPVPPDFLAAYNRRALIAVEFYKSQQDPFYPQGLGVDSQVTRSIDALKSQYPTVEFFSYEITNPGSARTSKGLRDGEYGTLAAQLGVGYTPFFATLAPQGDRYVIDNLFQGYVTRPVLSQALFDLTALDTGGNTSDVDVVIEDFELTETGGGIEYFTVKNESSQPVNLQGFSLRVLDPETGEVGPDAAGVTINEEIEVQPGESVSVGRVPDIVDADGRRVAGTFEGGQDLNLSPGDQLALVDSGGAIAATVTV